MSDRRQMLEDWISHCRGNRRRAFEYRRWALENPPDSPRFLQWKKASDRSWRAAWDALANARIQKEISQ